MARTPRPAASAAPATAPAADTDWDAPTATPAAPAPVPSVPQSVPEGHVKVRCVSDRQPWTDTKGLDFGEEAIVPKWVADIMLERGQVEQA